jgi:hypothetical protein
MPILNGLQVAKMYEAICMSLGIEAPPMILLTAFDKSYFGKDEFNGTKCIYMQKPLNADDLKQILIDENFI